MQFAGWLHPAAVRRVLDEQAGRHRLLGDPTRLAIVEALGDGPREVAELARLTGVHRNTVRAHLARLDAAGLLASETNPPAGRGRPPHRYRLREPLPISAPEFRVLIDALLGIIDRAHPEDAHQLGEAEGYRVGRQMSSLVAMPSRESAIRQVMLVLERLSFAPRMAAGTGTYTIALHACPFAVQPDDRRGAIVCAFHLGLMRGVVEAHGAADRATVALRPHERVDACVAEVTFRAS